MERSYETYIDNKRDIPALVALSLLTICGWISISLGFLLCPFVLFFCSKRIKRPGGFHFEIFDWSLLLVSIVEIFLLFYSSYMPNSIDEIRNVLYAITFWFIARICVINRETINRYLTIWSYVVFILSTITLFSYIKHRESFVQLGYTDMTLVRQYYHPLGFISNDWVSILICLLPMPLYSYMISRTLLSRIIHLAGFISVNVALFVSFSRAAYLSIFVFYVICIFIYLFKDNKFKKHFVKLTTITIIVSCVALSPDRQSVATTLAVSKTTTQQRSINGRYKKWKEAIDLFKQKPVVGVGGGNYANASVLNGSKDSDSLSNRSTNSYFQLMVEKGILGSIVYLLAILCFLKDGIKSVLKNPMCGSVLASIVALLVREFFFSSFFEEKRLPMLTIVLLFAILYNSYVYCNKKEDSI